MFKRVSVYWPTICIGAAVVRSDVLVRDRVCVHGVICVECVVFEDCGDSRNLGTAVR